MPTTTVRQRIPRGITVRQLAESQGIHPDTIRDKVASGEIPSYRIGGSIRIPLSYIEELQRRAYVEEVVAAMPPLSAAQIVKLTGLFDYSGAA